MPENDAPKPAANPQDGWWNLANLRGSLAGVLAKVDESNLPDYWKAAIKADIAARVGSNNFVYLDAHYAVDSSPGNKWHLNLTGELDTVL